MVPAGIFQRTRKAQKAQSRPHKLTTSLIPLTTDLEGIRCHTATFENTRETMTAMCAFNVASGAQPTLSVLICSDLPLSNFSVIQSLVTSDKLEKKYQTGEK